MTDIEARDLAGSLETEIYRRSNEDYALFLRDLEDLVELEARAPPRRAPLRGPAPRRQPAPGAVRRRPAQGRAAPARRQPQAMRNRVISRAPAQRRPAAARRQNGSAQRQSRYRAPSQRAASRSVPRRQLARNVVGQRSQRSRSPGPIRGGRSPSPLQRPIRGLRNSPAGQTRQRSLGVSRAPPPSKPVGRPPGSPPMKAPIRFSTLGRFARWHLPLRFSRAGYYRPPVRPDQRPQNLPSGPPSGSRWWQNPSMWAPTVNRPERPERPEPGVILTGVAL